MTYFVSKYYTEYYTVFNNFCSFKISLHDGIIKMWPMIGVCLPRLVTTLLMCMCPLYFYGSQ